MRSILWLAAGATTIIAFGNRRITVGISGPPPNTANVTYSEIYWRPAGTEMYFGARLEQESWIFRGTMNGSPMTIRWFEAPCSFTGFLPPQLNNVPVQMTWGQPSGASCGVYPYGPNDVAPVYVDYPWIRPVDLYRITASRPYNPSGDGYAPHAVTPRNPGAPAVEGQLDQYLDQGGSVATYRQWLDFQLRVPGVRNPLNPAEFNMPACTGLTVATCNALLPTSSSVSVYDGQTTDGAEIISQADPPGTDQPSGATPSVNTKWTPQAPAELPRNIDQEQFDADVVAAKGRIKARNPAGSTYTASPYTDAQVDVITRTCVWIAYKVAAVTPSDCGDPSLPHLIMAGTKTLGTNAPRSTLRAAEHDFEAITTNPDWARLDRDVIGKSGSGWQNAQPACQDPQPNEECDEYPYFSTEQGGSQARPLPSVELIPKEDNQAEGNIISSFYTTCPIAPAVNVGTTRQKGGRYLVLPITVSGFPSGSCATRLARDLRALADLGPRRATQRCLETTTGPAARSSAPGTERP